MARKHNRYDYAPDSYQPASNALGCPFAALSAVVIVVAALALTGCALAGTANPLDAENDVMLVLLAVVCACWAAKRLRGR